MPIGRLRSFRLWSTSSVHVRHSVQELSTDRLELTLAYSRARLLYMKPPWLLGLTHRRRFVRNISDKHTPDIAPLRSLALTPPSIPYLHCWAACLYVRLPQTPSARSHSRRV